MAIRQNQECSSLKKIEAFSKTCTEYCNWCIIKKTSQPLLYYKVFFLRLTFTSSCRRQRLMHKVVVFLDGPHGPLTFYQIPSRVTGTHLIITSAVVKLSLFLVTKHCCWGALSVYNLSKYLYSLCMRNAPHGQRKVLA